jgi:hypothetical protein
MRVEVDTAESAGGEPAPSSVRFDGRSIDIANVLDRWWGGGDRYFKVKDALDNIYVLRLDETRGAWELLMFLSKSGAGMPNLLAGRSSAHPRQAGDGRL